MKVWGTPSYLFLALLKSGIVLSGIGEQLVYPASAFQMALNFTHSHLASPWTALTVGLLIWD